MTNPSIIRPKQTLHIVDISIVLSLLDQDVTEQLDGLGMSFSTEKVRAISNWIVFETLHVWLVEYKTRLSDHYRYDDAKLVLDAIGRHAAVQLSAYILPDVFTDPDKFSYTAMISGTSLLVSKELKS